eukprot:XP_011436460.1 PREDICTED: uncharacterized protein LOC105334633 [Crassostrea gigas]
MLTYNEPFTSELNRKVKVVSCTHAFCLRLQKACSFRKLDKLTGDIALLRREVAELRGKSPASATSKAFKINTASCKRRFNLYLRSRFSCRPWLEVKSDDFKNEVHTCLAMDDMRTNPAAFQEMVSHSLHKFRELRNQFRRKILADKQSIPCKGLGELCYDIFHSYSKADECTLSQERMHATILLVSINNQ